MLIAVAGASGFVGSALRRSLAGEHQFIALTRSSSVNALGSDPEHTRWRHCDLFSLPKVAGALRGARCGFYLVHSMLPSSRLMQGNFSDMDVLLADNFARGAREAGLEHIVYLGGLIPRNQQALSPHLASRLEVESVLRQSGLPVTVLRAGLIVGPGGSSARMLIRLVNRLPFMILPRWTRSVTQSIDVRDVVRAFRMVVEDASLRGGTFDLGGHPPTTYGEMILDTARVLERKPVTLYFPGHMIGFSSLWVRLLSGVPGTLVNPLLESLRYDLSAEANPLLEKLTEARAMVPFEDSVRGAVGEEGRLVENPRDSIRSKDRSAIRAAKRVRSIQRLPLPKGWDAETVAEAYGEWLTRVFRGRIRVVKEGDGTLRFQLSWPKLELLVLSPTPYSRSGGLRRAFYITGGFLAQQVDPPGRLEFRVVPSLDCVIGALHGFAPKLPWWLYSQTQARVHVLVMRAFGRYLHRVGESRRE